jgi:hypothetical protein
MSDLTELLIVVITLACQYFLSSRANVYWGCIIPVVYICVLTWMFRIGNIESPLTFILYMLLGLVPLIGQWFIGRKAFEIKRKSELEKMSIHDI